MATPNVFKNLFRRQSCSVPKSKNRFPNRFSNATARHKLINIARHFIHLLEPLATMDGDFNADSNELVLDWEDAVVAQVVISNNTAMAMLQEDNAAVPDVIRESKHNNQPM